MRNSMIARVWHEGERVAEEEVIAVECDGNEIELVTEEQDILVTESSWDDLTVDCS